MMDPSVALPRIFGETPWVSDRSRPGGTRDTTCDTNGVDDRGHELLEKSTPFLLLQVL
jgi:hypothetical protein